MINLEKLDVRVEFERDLINRLASSKDKALPLESTAFYDLWDAIMHFSKMPNASIEFDGGDVRAVWSFRDRYYRSEAAPMPFLRELLLQQWLVYSQKAAEYEEANCVAIEEMSS